MAVFQWYDIDEQYVTLKFDFSPDASTLVNANFKVEDTDATPADQIDDPFDPIVITRDYQSISRELYLYWNTTLPNGKNYRLVMSGVKRFNGETIPDTYLPFVTVGATPTSESPYSKEVTQVEDYTVKIVTNLFDAFDYTNTELTESDEDFGIVDIQPSVTDAYYLGPYDFHGKIEVTFNHYVPANFINNSDFKLQKKQLSAQGIVPWTNVNTYVAQQSDAPIVSIYLPSTDTSPLYSFEVDDIEDHEFWEPGYKYRLIISKQVGY